MAHIIAAESAFPAHHYSQGVLLEAMRALWPEADKQRLLDRFFRRVHVEGRYLALPLESYATPRDMRSRHADWKRVALDLGAKVLQRLTAAAGIDLQELHMVASTTVTGIAVPSLEALLTNRMPLAQHVKRMPLFGLGCAGGAAGIARVADYLWAHPHHAAVLVAVELCSLNLQASDQSVANIIGSGLFGDGAAGVLMVGDRHPLASASRGRVVDTASWLFPDTERVMGWDVENEGLRLILSAEVPRLAREALPARVEALLEDHGLAVRDVDTWVAHPGGPAVLDGLEQGLSLPAGTLDASRESLAKVGNLSSASVLSILGDTLRREQTRPGSPGMVLAMGPGFGAEMVLMEW